MTSLEVLMWLAKESGLNSVKEERLIICMFFEGLPFPFSGDIGIIRPGPFLVGELISILDLEFCMMLFLFLSTIFYVGSILSRAVIIKY